MVERHRRRLAEAAARGERAAVPNFDWLVAYVDGVADAAHAPKGRDRARPPAQRTGDRDTGGGGQDEGAVGAH
jgi:hypothetical protein